MCVCVWGGVGGCICNIMKTLINTEQYFYANNRPTHYMSYMYVQYNITIKVILIQLAYTVA